MWMLQCLYIAMLQCIWAQDMEKTTPMSLIEQLGARRQQQQNVVNTRRQNYGFQPEPQSIHQNDPAQHRIPYPFNIFDTNPFSEGMISGKEGSPIPPGIDLPPELMELYSKFAHLLPQLAEAHQKSIKQIDYCNPQNPNDGRKCESLPFSVALLVHTYTLY